MTAEGIQRDRIFLLILFPRGWSIVQECLIKRLRQPHLHAPASAERMPYTETLPIKIAKIPNDVPFFRLTALLRKFLNIARDFPTGTKNQRSKVTLQPKRQQTILRGLVLHHEMLTDRQSQAPGIHRQHQWIRLPADAKLRLLQPYMA